MNHKSITPNPQQPVDRVPTGQLPSALAELSEAALNSMGEVLPLQQFCEADLEELQLHLGICSYDGNDE